MSCRVDQRRNKIKGDVTMSVAPKSAFNIEVLLDVILQIVAVINAVLNLFGISSL
jgi:hypothetical protein